MKNDGQSAAIAAGGGGGGGEWMGGGAVVCQGEKTIPRAVEVDPVSPPVLFVCAEAEPHGHADAPSVAATWTDSRQLTLCR